MNRESINLIKSFEGLELSAYVDAVGVWTIGYGHTAKAGPPIPKAGMTITEQEAERIFLKDLSKFENAVKNHVKVPLNENQYGALVSFCYNLGEGNFKQSTLLKKLNMRDYQGAANELLRWDKAGGETLRGLTRRRKAERELFLKGSVATKKPVQRDSKKIPTQVPKTTKTSVRPSMGILEAIINFLLMFIRGGK